MPTYPITEPANDAAPYTWTQPLRDGIAAANDHQTRITTLEGGQGAKANSLATINTQAGNYTLAFADQQNTIVKMTSSSAVTLTLPLNSTEYMDVGTSVDVLAYGTGGVTVAGAAGVSVRTTSTLVARARYSRITCTKIDVNEWLVDGDLA